MISYKNWSEVPIELASKTKLSKEGLKPLEAPVAKVFQRVNNRYIELYERSKSEKKRQLSDRQKLALLNGRKLGIEERTCKRCGHVVQSKAKLRLSLCPSCYEHQVIMNQLKETKLKIKTFINKTFINEDQFVILDTETTGLTPRDQIIEISVINLSGNILLNTLVKPSINIPAEATSIHGITNEMVQGAPSWTAIYKELREVTVGKTLLIYNAEFDLGMIENTCIANNVEFKDFKSTCVMKMYADYVDSKRWISLSDATELTIKHRAAADCFAVLELLQHLKNSQID
ncbi:DNA polymerase III subunit epsilon [Bacillus thuringiensis]|uniref:3'-5' exonuclease n=1 Tax=Bacillus thuringiensis TaxID=1428 RepID=UPI000BF4EA29|nr:3'-5' exonuclease [Bacillus thuringiensis]PFN92139.1 DNA polymerase III subunit epsilon [Bacillus thuringiensis]PGY05600.1 DNA polymerase III subunit epsilon [Bacillus thuringiensis]